MDNVLIRCRLTPMLITLKQEKKDKSFSDYKKCGPKQYGKQCPAHEKGVLCNRREYIMVSRCDECRYYSETEHPAECANCRWNPALSDNFEEN